MREDTREEDEDETKKIDVDGDEQKTPAEQEKDDFGAGLDDMDRKYLSCIINNYSGGPVGIDTLSAALLEQRDIIEDVIEPYLMQKGFVQRTPRGRKAQQKACDYFT